MGAMASLITGVSIVYSTVCPGADQRKLQRSASLALVRGIHRDRWIPGTKGQLRGKYFHLMTSSWIYYYWYGVVIIILHIGQFTFCFVVNLSIYASSSRTVSRGIIWFSIAWNPIDVPPNRIIAVGIELEMSLYDEWHSQSCHSARLLPKWNVNV